ncbi:MAG: hypothetical protein ABR592_02675 [Nitriliruptorales bacterium]
MTPPARRLLLGAVLPLSLVLAGTLPIMLLGDRLPEPVARHWDLYGRPDGSWPRSALLVTALGFTGVPAALMAAAVWRRNDGADRAALVAVTAFVASIGALASLVTVEANFDASSWRTAGISWAHVIGMVAGAALLAMIAGRLAISLDSAQDPDPPQKRATRLRPGERAAWLGTCRAWWALALAAVSGTVAVGAVPFRPRATPWALGLCLVGLALSSVRVAAGPAGLRIAMGPLGWPVIRIGLHRIEKATAVHVDPLRSWLGWGYRGSVTLFGRAALVLRRGPGLRLDLNGGKSFLVTVDDAVTAAAVLNDCVRLEGGGAL